MAVFCLSQLFGHAGAEDWPQWRGVNRDGVWNVDAVVDNLPSGQLPLVWSIPIEAGYSGPTVSNGRVYVMDRKQVGAKQTERVLCFDSETGSAIWQYEYEANYTVSYTAGPRASVTIESGKAYSVGAMGHFCCLDAETGNVAWKRDLNHDYRINMPI